MIDKNTITNFYGALPDESSKVCITIDTNSSCPVEVNMTGKFFISNAPIDLLEHNELIIVNIHFPDEPKQQLSQFSNILTECSDSENHICRKIEVEIKPKFGLDFIIGSPFLWFAIPSNLGCDVDTLILIFRKEDLFPLF